MSLVNKFIEFSKEQDIKTEDLYQEQGDGFSVISFNENGEPGILYNIAIVFYDNDDDVEIYIRKQISNTGTVNIFNRVKVFNYVNDLNAEYRGVTFFLEDGLVVLKTYIQANGDIEKVLRQMVGGMQIASEVFPKIK